MLRMHLHNLTKEKQEFLNRKRIILRRSTDLNLLGLMKCMKDAELLKKAAKKVNDVADKARAEAATAQKEKREIQHVVMQRMPQIERAERQIEERKEIESLMKSNNEQRASTVHVLESLLENEHAARAEANRRAEALSVKLQATLGKLDSLQQELTSVRLNESALDGKLKTASIILKLMESSRLLE